jgi:hypothetical protein
LGAGYRRRKEHEQAWKKGKVRRKEWMEDWREGWREEW